MFGARPSTLLILYRNALHVYNGPDLEISELEFPDEVIHNLEVVDPNRYQEIVYDALSSSGLRPQKALLLLSDEILFQKTLINSEGPLARIQRDEFYKSIPLSDSELARLEVIDGESIYLFGANRLLFQLLVLEFDKMGWEIVAVSPLVFFGQFKEREAIEVESVDQVLKSYNKDLPLDFLTFKGMDWKESSQKDKNRDLLTPILGISFLLVIGLASFLLIKAKGSSLFHQNQKVEISSQPVPDQLASPTSSPEESPSPIPSPSASTSIRDSLKIKIVNGSGIPGEAGKIKELLSKKGYSNIETANSDSSASATLFESTEDVPKNIENEILDQLKSLFDNVEQKAIAGTFFDIVITTSK